MTVIAAPHEFDRHDLFVDLQGVVGRSLHLRCAGVNLAGSGELAVAAGMVDAAERDGLPTAGPTLVATPTGERGVALAVVAAGRGYGYVHVTDPWCDDTTRRLIEAAGGSVHTVTVADPVAGHRGAVLDHAARLCALDAGHVLLDRYADAADRRVHGDGASAVLDTFPQLDVLFVAATTTDGVRRRVRARRPGVLVVAVDAPAAEPGTGPPRPDPRIVDDVDDVVRVDEADAVLACRRLAAHGYLVGAATGAVVGGALAWLGEHATSGCTAVAVARDRGERHLDTVHSRSWIAEHLGEDLARRVDDIGRDAGLASAPVTTGVPR